MLTNRKHVVQFVFNLLLAGLLILALGFERGSTSASAETQVVQSAVPGGPGYVMVPATAFVAENPQQNYSVFWGELSVPQGANPLSRFNAPLYLPQGSHFTGVTMYYRDTGNDGNTLGLDVYRKLLPSTSSGEGVGLSVYSNQIGFNLYQSDTTPDATRSVIDNSQYAYWIALYVYAAPSYLQLQAVRVDYGFDSSLPLVQR